MALQVVESVFVEDIAGCRGWRVYVGVAFLGEHLVFLSEGGQGLLLEVWDKHNSLDERFLLLVGAIEPLTLNLYFCCKQEVLLYSKQQH